MTPYRYQTEPLGEHHNRQAFSCGVEALDRYFRHQAGQDRRRRLTVPYVLTDPATGAVIGYYTLSTASILPASLPHGVARRLPRYESFPAILLGRLAVDYRHRGQGFGGLLLQDALQRCLEAGEQIGVMAVVVDALDDSARVFCERFGFRRLADHEHRLYLPTTDIPRL